MLFLFVFLSYFFLLLFLFSFVCCCFFTIHFVVVLFCYWFVLGLILCVCLVGTLFFVCRLLQTFLVVHCPSEKSSCFLWDHSHGETQLCPHNKLRISISQYNKGVKRAMLIASWLHCWCYFVSISYEMLQVPLRVRTMLPLTQCLCIALLQIDHELISVICDPTFPNDSYGYYY